jgi:hypothetical protein
LGFDFNNNEKKTADAGYAARKSVDFDNYTKNNIIINNYEEKDKISFQSMNKLSFLLENYVSCIHLPQILPIFTNKIIKSLEVGSFHNLVYLTNGKVFAFGSNLENQIINVKGI